MMPPETAPIIGTLLHTVGAACAALCYSPQRYLHRWSWQTYWLVQATGCWLVLPWIFAYFTIPQLGTVLAEAPKGAMVNSYLFGVVYGVGGISFGLAIRYIGFSLTYAIAIGVSCVVGTLVPPLVSGTLGATFASIGGFYVIIGVFLGTGAILSTGFAGFRKEKELESGGTKSGFNFRIGLPVVLVAGVLSAVYSFALTAGQPVADVAAQYGAGHFEGNVIYIFSNNGAFTTTLIYVIWLATRQRSWGEFRRTGDGSGLLRNYLLGMTTGLLWYLQFFFYGLGHVRMGDFRFSSWAIHMIILVLLSCGFGVLIGEWKAARAKTRTILATGVALLLGAVAMITYGNQLTSAASDTVEEPVPVPVDPTASVQAWAELENPTDFARHQEPIEFPLADLGLAADDPRIADLVARDNGQVLPSQLVDIRGDGEVDTLLVAIDFAPGEMREIEILFDAAAAAARADLPKQTQAEIAHKVGGEWQDQKYVGGEWQNVDHLIPPPQYTDHSEWIRYEGPGIESDKVGYRVYLDWRNGFDIFGKKTPDMILQDTGLDGYASYHEMQDWGMDILLVGQSLGIGGYGFWNGSEVEMVADVDQREVTIVEDGPLYSAFQIDYHGWQINDQNLDMSAHLAMNAGSRLVHTRLSLSERLPNMAIGMVKHPDTELLQGDLETSGYAWTYTASWGQQSLSDDDSYLGMAVLYRRGHRSSQVEDDSSYVSVMNTAGETADTGEVEYFFLAAWDGEHDTEITSREAFVEYLDEQAERLTITPRIRLQTRLSREAKAGELTPEQALHWSEALARSELERKTMLYHADGWDTYRRRVPKFEYDIVGLQPMAYDELNKVAPDEAYAEVPYANTGTFVTEDGDIRSYSVDNFNIDHVKPGVVILRLYQQTGEEKYRQAADLLREQLREHPRTREGGFWHKQTYPHQIWLDGVYMGMPFMAEYALMFEEGETRDATLREVVKEFELVYEHLRDPDTGLYYHAWDESREMFWADPETGLSPHFWGRGMGWYAMALVDVLDFLPDDREDLRAPILQAIRELAPALVRVQDPETGTWYQVLDQPERTGNYREASASAMFSYFFSKAVRKGYLDASYRDAAMRAYEGLIEEFVLVHPDDRISVVNQCLVGGLGFGRDGSFDYYMSERIVRNDPKGNGPFILAGIETYRLLTE